MKITEILRDDIVIYCETPSQIEQVMKIADEQGLKPRSGGRYSSDTLIKAAKKDLSKCCIRLSTGTKNSMNYYSYKGHTIISAELFIRDNSVQPPISKMETTETPINQLLSAYSLLNDTQFKSWFKNKQEYLLDLESELIIKNEPTVRIFRTVQPEFENGEEVEVFINDKWVKRIYVGKHHCSIRETGNNIIKPTYCKDGEIRKLQPVKQPETPILYLFNDCEDLLNMGIGYISEFAFVKNNLFYSRRLTSWKFCKKIEMLTFKD